MPAVVFAGINRANAVISLIAGIEGGNFNAQLAEARFLRGHFNFELQKMWGNVPYISEQNYTDKVGSTYHVLRSIQRVASGLN